MTHLPADAAAKPGPEIIGKNLRPTIDHHILEPITEEPSFMEDDEPDDGMDNESGNGMDDEPDNKLNDSIISFQNFLQGDVEPQEVSDSHHGYNSSAPSDNEVSDDDVDLESDDKLEQKLHQLMPRMNPQRPQHMGRTQKKPGSKPKYSSIQKGRSNADDILNLDAKDPRTCGMYFPFLDLFFSLMIRGSIDFNISAVVKKKMAATAYSQCKSVPQWNSTISGLLLLRSYGVFLGS